MTIDLDLDDIESKARAATPGAWINGTDPSHFGAPEVTDGKTFAYFVPDDANAAHIAAAEPASVLALVVIARAAKALCDAQREGRRGDYPQDLYDALTRALEEAGLGLRATATSTPGPGYSDEPRQITQGLLEALVLTPIADPGEAPKFLDVQVQGLSGLRATLDIAAVQELRQALNVILGPQATPDLAILLRRYFEVYDRPCATNGDWDYVDEYRVLDTQLRQLVGAPGSKVTL